MAGTIYGNNPKTGEKLDSNEFGGACNLGSLFLHNFVENPFTSNAKIDFEKLKYAIYIAVRFLDNIINKNHFPNVIYENYQKSFRTIGLGVTGLADMMTMLNIKYNSKKAEDFTYELMNYISFHAYLSSIELAKEKGEFNFLDRDRFVQSGFLTKHVEKHQEWEQVVEGIKQYGIRNAKIMSVAPTGTISLTYGNNCSSGIEPIFSLSYDRKVKMGGQSEDDIKIVKMQDYAYHLWLNTKEDNIVTKDVFITALDMTVNEHINILKNIAFHVDMSVSKTINVPTDYSFEDTKNIYMACYENGIKGCTIFRPNEIRQGILISDNNNQNDNQKVETILETEIKYDSIVPISRKSIGTTHGNTYCKKCACGTLYITINRDENENIVESFVHTSKGGICQANIGAINRMISLALRSGVKTEEIIDQLKGINCPACVKVKTKGDHIDGISCPDILARTLMEFENSKSILNNTNSIQDIKDIKKVIDKSDKSKCPECGYEVNHEGGCVICTECGWSKCD